MLIKAADDKQPQIDTLEALRTRPDVDAETKTQIDREIKNIRAGAKGERDAAYEIDFFYAKEPACRSTSRTPGAVIGACCRASPTPCRSATSS